jgi:peptidoglycan/xylan/chitin deacetylase (PgdA/CDA1 family)
LMNAGSHPASGADRSKTVEAVDRLIANYKARAYKLANVPDMMHPPISQ